MNFEKRKKEILSKFKSFSNDKCKKENLLNELMLFQDELLKNVFSEDFIKTQNSRIKDILKPLEQRNENVGGVASNELEMFRNDCFALNNKIVSECLGKKGENDAKKNFDYLKCENKVLNNIELEYRNHRTEIDSIVFTEKAIYIIEVKHTTNKTKINEQGELIIINDNHKKSYEKSLNRKLREKEYVLRNVLKEKGYDNLIIEICLLFTGESEVIDNFHKIKWFKLDNILTYIESYGGNDEYTKFEIKKMSEDIQDSIDKQEYDVLFELPNKSKKCVKPSKIKEHFINLLNVLENAEERKMNESKTNTKNMSANGALIFGSIGGLFAGVGIKYILDKFLKRH